MSFSPKREEAANPLSLSPRARYQSAMLALSPRGLWFLAAAGLYLPGAAVAQDRVTPPVIEPGALDPESPLAPLPDLGVDWPDLSGLDATADSGTRMGEEIRYEVRLAGVETIESPLFATRFDQLSTLKANDGDPANAGQVDRRAREDAELLVSLLRIEGYYDARVAPRIETDGQGLVVTLEAEPGPLYRFTDVTLNGLAAAGDKVDALRAAFGVDPRDPVNADAVVAGEANLRATIGEEGFPFATVGAPQVVVDREALTATLDIAVTPGAALRFGRITSDGRIFDADHIQDIARFRPGEEYDASGLEDLRRALVQTGLVSTTEVKPVPGIVPGTVDIAVALEPAPPRTIAGGLGYGTGEGARAEASWTHRNFIRPEGAVTFRGVAGTREQLLSAALRRNNFRGRDRVLNAQIAAARIRRDAYDAQTFSISGNLERQTNIFFQKTWTWSVGAELLASDERDVILSTGAERRRTFFIGALPASLNYDGSDDLLNPTRGFRLGGRLSPELSLQGAAFGYARAQIDASGYYPVSERVVAAGRVRLGTIAGAPRDAVAPSRRFYAGGGGSVRGFGFQNIGPRDPNNDPIGGRSLTEFSLEARVRVLGNFGVVPFIDGGNIYTSPLPRFTDFRFGTGIGVRYYSNFGPIRVDVGTPINPQPGDPRIAVYVSLGQAF